MIYKMNIRKNFSNRRQFLARLSQGFCLGLIASVTPWRAWAGLAEEFPTEDILEYTKLDEAIAEYTGNSKLRTDDRVVLDAPLIAENGNVVPIKIDMRSLDQPVEQVAFFVANNPRPFNSVYHFHSKAQAFVSFRIKMLESSDVVAVAKLGSGEFVTNTANIKVTTGGCGG